MAEQQPGTSNPLSDSSDSCVELKIKTLSSQVYTVTADKNMLVSAFKEKIAGQIGLPVEQQRLIFRGKVLKDEHPLSEYHVENGHTLHLVERQTPQPQQPSGSNDGSPSSNNSGRAGLEPGLGGLRSRMGQMGQMGHSVVLGSFNFGELGEEVSTQMPDINRVIGAVLNSFGAGGQPGMQPNGQVPQRSGTAEPTQGAASQTPGTNQPQMGQPFTGQSLPRMMQIPVGASIALPSLNMPIPDSLNTMCEFVSRLEQAMSRHGYSSNESAPNTDNPQTTQLPSSPSGFPTPEALSIVLRRIQQLLGGQATAALSHVAGRMEQEAGSTNDPALRGQIMTESVQLGAAMQHLGALLLELGRTMLSTQIGHSPIEFSVNAGPAVYISPSGPNPIMVQPFPLQTSSIFGSSPTAAPSIGSFGPLGLGSIQRNVNIHIHAGNVPGAGAGTNSGEGTQGERANVSSSGQPQTRSTNSGAVPGNPAAAGGAPQEQAVVGSGNGSNRAVEPSQPLSVAGSDVAVSERRNDEAVGASESSKPSSSAIGSSSSSQGAPLGLGLQGLLAKRQNSSVRRSSSSVGGRGRGSTQVISRQFSQPSHPGQAVLQSLARAREGSSGGTQPGPSNVGNAMSQASGADTMRSLVQQMAQNPAMQNTMSRLAEELDINSIGGMMSGLGGAQGGGFDLSRMVQQMMPIVSQALGGASAAGPSSGISGRAGLINPSVTENSQVDLHQVAERIEQNSPPVEIFRSVVENAVNSCDDVDGGENVVNDLCNVEGLSEEFMEMLRQDIRQRFQDEGN